MLKRKEVNNTVTLHSEQEGPGPDSEELQGVLRRFRDSVFAEADRPDFFWIRQRNAIMDRLNKPGSPRRQPAFLWAPAVAVLLFCLFFLTKNGEAPPPDFAAGYDQDLLIRVERALNRSYPDALAPALLLIPQDEHNKRVPWHWR